jgi:dsRNA-specific ribonuclease
VECLIEGRAVGAGVGHSKKVAEQEAARRALLAREEGKVQM